MAEDQELFEAIVEVLYRYHPELCRKAVQSEPEEPVYANEEVEEEDTEEDDLGCSAKE